MRSIVILSAILFVGLWTGSVYVLLGGEWANFSSLEYPSSTSDLGESLGLLNGLLSSIAIVLALLAVLIQSKELKDSTRAQNEQAESLKKQLEQQQSITKAQLKQAELITKQLEQQQISNRIVGLSARQRYLLSEMSRMDSIISSESASETLIDNCKKKKSRLQGEAKGIDKEIEDVLA